MFQQVDCHNVLGEDEIPDAEDKLLHRQMIIADCTHRFKHLIHRFISEDVICL